MTYRQSTLLQTKLLLLKLINGIYIGCVFILLLFVTFVDTLLLPLTFIISLIINKSAIYVISLSLWENEHSILFKIADALEKKIKKLETKLKDSNC